MPDRLIIRAAGAADIPAIVALLADDDFGRSRETTGPELDPRYLAAFEAIVRDPNQLQVVALIDREIVGCMQLTFIPGLSQHGAWRCQVEAVRIARHLRGQGYGRRLMQWTAAEASARGCRMVQLTSNSARTAAHGFYRNLGFTQSHVGFKLSLDGCKPVIADMSGVDPGGDETHPRCDPGHVD